MFNKLQHLTKYLVIIAVIAMTGLFATAQSGPPSQPATTQSAQAGAGLIPAVPQASGSLSLEERITRLEERLNLALALKDERIQSINERSENTYKMLQFFGAFAALGLVFFSIRDIALRWKEGQRQRGIDEIVKNTLNLQQSAVTQQVRIGELRLKHVETDPGQQFDAVKNVNDVIGVVRQTLAFRLLQEQNVVKVLEDIARIKEEQERAKKQKLKQALAICDHFKEMSRMQFATLTDEQYKRGIRLEGLVNDLDESLVEQDFDVMGWLLYTCGVIAYYDNDIIGAKAYLDRAAECRASDHKGELVTNASYRNRFAFIHYFRSLVHKNWGDLSEAQREIDQSANLIGDQAGEFLTPVTKAEIESYLVGNEERCRTDLQGLIKLIDQLEGTGRKLNVNQMRLRNRMLLLLGNTYFGQKKFSDALPQYIKAIGFNPNDYYALAAAAQCYRALGDAVAEVEHFRKSLVAIEHSGDLRRKRERITRAVIAVTAASAAKGCSDNERQEQYTREARELLSGDLDVEGMSPKFFSPSTKRLVSAAELLKEVDL